MKLKKLRKGFTLVELVVVIAVIAILTGASVGAYFGITDKAKESSALTTKSEVMNLWNMYSIEHNSSQLSKDELLDRFCLEYVPSNGLNIDTNYLLLEKRQSNGSSTIISSKKNKNSNIETTDQALILCETEYPTYFTFDFNTNKIEDVNTAFRKIDDLKKNINENESIDKELNSSTLNDFNEKGVESMNIKTVVDSNTNETTRISSKDVLFNINIKKAEGNELVELPSNMSLGQFNPNYSDYTIREQNGAYYRPYELTYENGAEYDSTIIYSLEGHTFTKRTDTDGKVTFLSNEIVLNYKTNAPEDLDIIHYPVILGSSDLSKINYFDNFSVFATIFESLKTEYNGGYIFVGTTTLNDDFTIPSGYSLVVDFLNSAAGEKDTMENWKKTYVDSTNKLYTIGSDSNRTGSNDRRSYNSNAEFMDVFYSKYKGETRKGNKINEFTISKDATLTIESNSVLAVEAKQMPPAGGNAYCVGDYSIINNNGTIINNGTIKAYGYIEGNGTISSLNESKIIEPFKMQDFKGGTISKGFYNQKAFPLDNWRFDAIRCRTIIDYGANYVFTSSVWANPLLGNQYNDLNMSFISKDAGLFVMHNGSQIIKEFNLEHFNNCLELNKGTIEDNSMSFKIVSVDVNSIDYPFSFSNIDLKIAKNATLNLDVGANYVFTPNSRLINEGVVNFNSNSKILFLSAKTESFNAILDNMNGGDNGKDNEFCYREMLTYDTYEELSMINRIIGSGTINLNTSESGLFGDLENNSNQYSLDMKVNKSVVINDGIVFSYKYSLKQNTNKFGSTEIFEKYDFSRIYQ